MGKLLKSSQILFEIKASSQQSPPSLLHSAKDLKCSKHIPSPMNSGLYGHSGQSALLCGIRVGLLVLVDEVSTVVGLNVTHIGMMAANRVRILTKTT